MKKNLLSVALTVLVSFFVLSYVSDAQGRGRGQHNNGTNFVDADGDGVCDYFVDEDGDGVCDHCTGDGTGNQGSGQGANFVDEDGDGVCDLFVDEDGDGVCDHCIGDGTGNNRRNGNNGNNGSGNKGNGGNGGGVRARNFTDLDGDGVCDNMQNLEAPSSIQLMNFVDEDGDGVCDNAGQGANFVDEDGDGVCDNAGQGNGRRGRGHGMRGQGRGNGGGFVDEDGDGQCDNYTATVYVNHPTPNPFSESTELSFTISEDGHVTGTIYDYEGNEVQVIVDADLTAGDYSYTFVPENLETGRYLFTVQFGDYVISKPLIYVQ